MRVKDALRDVFVPFETCDNPLEAGGLRALCHDQWPDDPHLAAAWDQLWSEVPRATGFHTYEWQRAAWNVLGKPGRLRLILVWQARRLVAALPMNIRDDGLLETLGPAVTDFLDPLILPDQEAPAWELILQLIIQLRSEKRRRITLHYVRDDSPCRALLPELAARHGLTFSQTATEQTPILRLPATWDDFLGGFDAHERKEMRRKVNKVMTRGNGRIVRCPPEAAAIIPALSDCLRLMELAPGAKGLAVRTMLRPLLEQAAPALIARGRLWLDTLYVNDQPLAAILQFPYSYGPMLWNCGFDNAMKEWSPGVVILNEAIRQSIEKGDSIYDMLRGQEPYKYKLGAVDRPLWMINLEKS